MTNSTLSVVDSTITLLNQGWVGISIGIVVAIAITIYTRRNPPLPNVIFQSRGQRLLDGDSALLPSDISVQYKGNNIPRVSLTQIIIWNNGRVSVRANDIETDDPIKFSFSEDTQILYAEVCKTSREINHSSVTLEQDNTNSLIYSFSFLDYKDGALIRIAHTGKNPFPSQTGTIIGAKNGIINSGYIDTETMREKFLGMVMLPVFFSLSTFACYKLIVDAITASTTLKISANSLFAAVFLFLSSVCVFAFRQNLISAKNLAPYELMPEEIKKRKK